MLPCGRTVGPGKDVRGSTPRTNELLVEGAEIDLLLALDFGTFFGWTGADFIFHGHSQKPTVAFMRRRDLERGDGGDLAQFLALRVAKMIFALCRDCRHGIDARFARDKDRLLLPREMLDKRPRGIG